MALEAGDVARYANLTPGDPAPWFQQRTSANPRFAFDSAAGRYLVLCFFASAADSHARAAIDAALERPDLFDDQKASFFGVSLDPADETEKRIADRYPGFRFFWDFDGRASRAYGAIPLEGAERLAAARRWVVVDPMLRVIAVIPFGADRCDIAQALRLLESLPPPSVFCGVPLSPPVLLLPNVFEPEFCRALVELYESHGGEDSGFMREVDGRTVGLVDYRHKRRRDYLIDDPQIIERAKALVHRRLAPEILKAHQFRATRIERFIVACYDAAEEAHFKPHRDNTTSGTAHRRFAVSINLNDDFEGGEVYFPEYGEQTKFRPPAGGALVFSCSILHAVAPMRRGKRYAFLPFLYDEEAAKLREANNARLGEGIGAYRA
jgi:peroxiredoxin